VLVKRGVHKRNARKLAERRARVNSGNAAVLFQIVRPPDCQNMICCYFVPMKFFAAFAILLAIALPQARAQQTPDDQYVAIYSAIQGADSMGNSREALAGYIAAQGGLQKFQKLYPDWNPKIVNFRLNELSEKITALTAQFPATNASPQTMPAPSTVSATNIILPAAGADVESQLREQAQVLQSENTVLAAKLKEALAAQPATIDPRELEKAQAQIESLMKENDLLKASLAQKDQLPPATNSIPPQTNDEVETLRARLAVDEAQAVPYSPEELALFKQPEPQPTNSVASESSVTKLPAGSQELVAEAQSYFSAREYDKAEADYLRILEKDPNNALAEANLAAIEMEENKLDAAEKHINSAIAQNPNDAYNVSLLGYLKFRQQKFDEALDALSRAAKLDPQNPQVQNYLGVTLSHKGLRAQAETALRKAILLDPDYGPAHNNLAVVYINGQPPSAALARWHYQKALDLGQPRNPDLEKLLADKGAPVDP
jgi:tetratricopeptide (TPR) repeat protein